MEPLSLNRTLLLAKTLLIIVILGALGTTVKSLSTENDNRRGEEDPVRCVCDGECERIWEEDCRWGLTLDFCGCCLLCSRGEGEPCGGALGTCAHSLYCRNSDPNRPGEGTCSKPRQDEKVCEEPVRRYGCLFHGGSCICGNQTVCPEMEMFLFDTDESCRSRVAILMAARQLQPASSSSSSSGASSESSSSSSSSAQGQKATVNCSDVTCEPVVDCPADSYRLPALSVQHHVHHHHHLEAHLPDETSRGKNNDCCPLVQKCQCNPGHLCPKPECPTGWEERFIVNATGEPGNCCPLLECSPPAVVPVVALDNTARITEDTLLLCSHGNVLYKAGDVWLNQEEDCSECTCSANGVVSCHWIKCDDVPRECRVARAPPDACCPVCAGCITNGGRIFNNSETWNEDECTVCECEDGKVKCHASVCQATCVNPIYIPGECCPQCPPGELRGGEGTDEDVCPQVDCEGRTCAGGYLLDVHGCPTCQCNECPALDCSLDCPQGFHMDSHGCPICSCKSAPAPNSARMTSGRSTGNNAANGCTSLDEKHGVIARAEGDEWWDGCRHCVCKNGLEMCTLISCNPPECEHPIFYPGDCCPRCPGDEAPIPRQIDSSCTVGTSVDLASSWKVTKCLTCSCHNSLLVCSHPICPPAPCEMGAISGDPPCCHSCAHARQPEESSKVSSNPSKKNHGTKVDSPSSTPTRQRNISSVVVGMRKCSSEDNHNSHNNKNGREFDDGETWTSGPCQSCVCRNGEIECFSSWRSCPPLSCDQPVFAKNQCCPICLELTRLRNSHGKSSSDLNPLVATLLVVLLCLVFIIALFTLRCVFQRRRSRRRLADTSNKPAPNYC